MAQSKIDWTERGFKLKNRQVQKDKNLHVLLVDDDALDRELFLDAINLSINQACSPCLVNMLPFQEVVNIDFIRSEHL